MEKQELKSSNDSLKKENKKLNDTIKELRDEIKLLMSSKDRESKEMQFGGEEDPFDPMDPEDFPRMRSFAKL